MLPRVLVSTYQRYKDDTKSIAEYLASTAKAAGCPAAVLSPQQTDRSVYVIRVCDYVPLAVYIAKSAVKKRIKLPTSLAPTIERVIAARAGFAAKLERHGCVLDAKSNESHMHFVEVLKEVLETLSQVLTKPTATKPTIAQTAQKSKPQTLDNQFDKLHVFESSREFEDGPVLERPEKPKNDAFTYKTELPTTFDDAMFALTTLVDDMNNVKKHILQLWDCFNEGSLSHSAVAVATNTTVELVKQSMADVTPLLDLHGGLNCMLSQLYLFRCAQDGVVTSAGNPDYQTSRETYHSALTMLYNLRCPGLAGSLPVNAPPRVLITTQYDGTSTQPSTYAFARYVADWNMLKTLVPLVRTLFGDNFGWPAKDELCWAIWDMDHSRDIPFHALFAAQVTMDVYHSCSQAEAVAKRQGHDTKGQFEQLLEQLHAIEDDVREELALPADKKCAGASTGTCELNKRLVTLLEITEAPRLFPAALNGFESRLNAPRDIPRNAEAGPLDRDTFDILRLCPIISGLVLHFMRDYYRQQSLGVENHRDNSLITRMANLYNIMQPQLTRPWVDMEMACASLGLVNLFVGGARPVGAQSQRTKYMLRCGHSIRGWAANNYGLHERVPVGTMRKEGVRPVESMSLVTSAFRNRFTDRDGAKLHLDAETLARIIEMSLFEQQAVESLEDGNSTSTTTTTVVVMNPITSDRGIRERRAEAKELVTHRRFLRPLTKARRTAMQAKYGDLTSSSISALVMPLALALHAEVPDVAFPLMAMNRTIRDSLIKMNIDESLECPYSRPRKAGDIIFWIVDYLLCARGMCGPNCIPPDRIPLPHATSWYNEWLKRTKQGKKRGESMKRMLERHLLKPIRVVDKVLSVEEIAKDEFRGTTLSLEGKWQHTVKLAPLVGSGLPDVQKEDST